MGAQAKQVLLNIVAATPAIRVARRVRNVVRPRADLDKAADGILDRLQRRRTWIGDDRIRGGSVLEIGSGVNFGLALLLVHLGARRVVNVEIDRDGFIRQPDLYRRLSERARHVDPALDLAWPPVGLLEDDDRRAVRPDPARITLYLGRSAADIPEPDESFDVTFSVSVLQHVRRRDIAAVAGELYRVTRHDGVGYHRVDLTDLESGDPLEHLGYTEPEYLRMYGNRRAYTNRLRMDDLGLIFERAGFRDVHFEDIKSFDDAGRLARMRPNLAAEFRGKSDEMLLARSCMLVIRR